MEIGHSGREMERAESSNGNAALEDHLKRRGKQIQHDRTMMGLMKKGLDVPFSHTRVKNHPGIAGTHQNQ